MYQSQFFLHTTLQLLWFLTFAYYSLYELAWNEYSVNYPSTKLCIVAMSFAAWSLCSSLICEICAQTAVSDMQNRCMRQAQWISDICMYHHHHQFISLVKFWYFRQWTNHYYLVPPVSVGLLGPQEKLFIFPLSPNQPVIKLFGSFILDKLKIVVAWE